MPDPEKTTKQENNEVDLLMTEIILFLLNLNYY